MASQSGDNQVNLSVLALDVVSYSVEFDQVQERVVAILGELIQEAIQTVSETVRSTVLPTGDGAIVALEFGGASDAVDLGSHLRRAIDDRLLRLPLRMGVHCGRARIVVDPAGRRNYVGSVLNLAQRIMDLGDEGHLLLSAAAAEELKHDATHSQFVRPVSSNPVTVSSTALNSTSTTTRHPPSASRRNLPVRTVPQKSCSRSYRVALAEHYRSGTRFSYTGGHYKRSPVQLAVPHAGHWHVVVDLGGAAAGRVNASVSVQPA
jgi:class 3 adenylate cyclase